MSQAASEKNKDPAAGSGQSAPEQAVSVADALLAGVNGAFTAGKLEDARQLSDTAMAAHPGDCGVMRVAAMVASWGGEFGRAAELADEMSARSQEANDEASLVDARMLMVDVLTPQNRLEEAEGVLDSVPEAYAQHELVLLRRVFLLRAQWRLDDSDALMARIYAKVPENPWVRLHWGWTQQHAGHYCDALATFGDMDLPEAKALYCETLTFNGQWDEALRRLNELIKESPFNILALQVQGMVLLRRHRYDEVIKIADKIMTVYRGDSAAYQLKAAALVRSRRVEQALQTIGEGRRLFPMSSGLKVHNGWANFALRNMATAEREFQELADRRPHDVTAKTGLGAIAFRRCDYEAALDLFQAVARDSRGIDPGVDSNLALTLAALNSHEEAAEHCSAALMHDPGNTQALICESALALRSGERGRARMRAQEAHDCDPGDSSCRVNLAAVDSALGAYEDARKQLEELIRDDPLFAQAHLELGVLEFKQGKNGLARLHLRRALEVDRTLSAGYRALAEVELDEGRLAEAEVVLREGIERIGRNDVSLLVSLGHVLRLLGEQSQSADCYEEASAKLTAALQRDQKNALARFELGVVQLRQGAFNAARRTFEQMLQAEPGEPHAQVMLTRIGVVTKEPRLVRSWSIALAVLAVAQAATAWAAFLAGKLSATTFSALLSLFVGLLLVAALFPKLTKVKLGGLEAELTSVTYRPEAKAVAGPSAQLQMTTAASVAAAFWFWQ